MGKLAELQKQIINATWKLRRQQGTALTVAKDLTNLKPVSKSPGLVKPASTNATKREVIF